VTAWVCNCTAGFPVGKGGAERSVGREIDAPATAPLQPRAVGAIMSSR
jgi:hypothetical protein